MRKGSEPVTVTAYPDGPLLLRGAYELRNASGELLDTHRRTVALCRCGLSGAKPFCDGTHKLSGFRTDEEPESPAESRPVPPCAAGQLDGDDEGGR